MKSKLFSLFALSVFALVFLVGLASAVSLDNITVYTIPTSVPQTAGSFNIVFDLTNTGTAGTLDFSTSTVSTGSLSFNDTAIAVSPITETITATITFSTTFSGTISGVINVTGTGMSTFKTLPFSVIVTQSTSDTPSEITSCTSVRNPGNIEIKKIDFTNNGMKYNNFGKDDEWFPLESIDVQIDVKNLGNANDDKVNNIEVNWGLYDTNTNEWVIELVDEKDFDLKSGKTNTMTISFKLDDKDLDVDISDLTDGDHYIFYVTAKGEVDNENDTVTCVSDFEKVSIIIESDFVVIDNFQLPETASCGSTIEVSADVWNIGDNDPDEVSVLVTNKELGLSEEISVGDMDAFDNEKISFTFKVPSNATEKTYGLNFQVLDDDSDVFQNDYDDDYAEFTVPLTVKGGCTGLAAPVTVTANLVSGGKAGQDLVIKAALINTGSTSTTYILSAAGQGEWASSYTVQPSTLTLVAGQSGEAIYTFKVNSDASGEQTFYIEIVSGTQITRQLVSVTIEKAGLFSSITGRVISGSSWVWGLGILNVVLILVIILVALRVMRK